MDAIAPQITSLTIVYSTVYSDADQRKYQSAASLAFVRGIHRGPVNSTHKWPVTRKTFPFEDVIMTYLALGSTWIIARTALVCLIEAIFYLWIVLTWYLQYPFLSTRNLWHNVVKLFEILTTWHLTYSEMDINCSCNEMFGLSQQRLMLVLFSFR